MQHFSGIPKADGGTKGIFYPPIYHQDRGRGMRRGQYQQSAAKSASQHAYHEMHVPTPHGLTSMLAHGQDATRSDTSTITPVNPAA